MWLSYKKKFLFIHIPKVAGVSIKNSLKQAIYTSYDYELWKHRLLRRLNLAVNPEIWSKDHATAEQIRNKIGSEKYNQLFKFAFVRNPWDWNVSLYNYILRQENHFQHDLVTKMSGFEEYLEWRVTKDNHKRLQKDFVTDKDGCLIVDFIGKFENLESDFNQVCNHLNISAKLLHLNKSKKIGKTYKNYYNNRCKNIIYENFNEDIDFFGYSFDD